MRNYSRTMACPVTMWACFGVLVGALTAAEPKAGVPLGSSPKPFMVKDITGPNSGKVLCYR